MRGTKETGITLIALVVTIVILLILAGVAINLTVGDNGIFKRAQESVQIYENAANNEATGLNIAAGEIGKLIMETTLDIQYTTTTNSITVTVIPQGAEKYIYSYKKTTEETYTVATEQEGNIYTFEGLEDGVKYNIKVEVINEGIKVEKEIEVTTGEMPAAIGMIEFGNLVWENGQASVSMTSTNPEYEIQYQVNGDEEGNWKIGTTASNLDLGVTVYARLWDGINAGSSASITISEITPPQINMNIGQITTNSIQVSASATDNEAGMPVTPVYKYYIKKNTDANYPATPTYEGAETTYTFSGLTHNTEYDIKIEVADKAGNVGQITSAKNKTVELTAGDGAITFGEITWNSSGKASVNMSTTTSHTIQYQINSTAGEWKTGTTASNLSLNNVVYARLWDGVNVGDSVNIKITDTVIPNAATISFNNTNTDTNTSITATVTLSDSQTGVNVGACKWVYNTTSTAIGTDATSYTGTFSSASQNLSLKATTPGTYYLHVLTTDNAGNVRETISDPVTVVQLVTGISLNKTSTTLAIGATEKLIATVKPDNATNKTLEWSSSDTTIATVDGGTITGKATGTATITATTTDGSGKSASCAVRVGKAITTLNVGDYIKYDSGNNGVITCRVLYNDATNGIQIVSNKNVKQVTIGGTTWETAKASYNTAIETLNNEAEVYLNTNYAVDARCVGSLPTVNASGVYTQKDSGANSYWVVPSSYPIPTGLTSRDTGWYASDANFSADRNALTSAGLLNTGERYFLASRFLGEDGTYFTLGISKILTDGSLNRREFSSLSYRKSSGAVNFGEQTRGLRPCFSLKSDILLTGGDGKSAATAYTM